MDHSLYGLHINVITALARVKNDIMMSIEQGKQVLFALLNLSAAFDTVDHTVFF